MILLGQISTIEKNGGVVAGVVGGVDRIQDKY